jgi:hypothetical protein
MLFESVTLEVAVAFRLGRDSADWAGLLKDIVHEQFGANYGETRESYHQRLSEKVEHKPQAHSTLSTSHSTQCLILL